MPQFLTTSGTAHYIEDIIIRAKTELVLITPYLKLSRILFERLTEADAKGVKIKLVYGKSELRADEKKRLAALTHLELLYLENLHAKCYYNETTLIISSMNLYEFSEKNNREMGIALTLREDANCFADALAEANSILTAARGSLFSTKSSVPTSSLDEPAADSANPVKKFDYHQKTCLFFELLNKEADFTAEFVIRTEPHAFGGGSSTIITATDFPYSGVNFSYDGAIRLDFRDSRKYQSIKSLKQSYFNTILVDYRCYWNRDVIQVYSAKKYEYTDELTVAKYHLQALKKAVYALKPSSF
jgi:hypothetical protein